MSYKSAYERFLSIFYRIYYLSKLKIFIRLRRKTSDFSIFRQIFMFKEYDFDLGFTPKVIVDAGANVGYASLWFSQKYKNAKIISIEPEESNFKLLCKHIESIKNIIPIKFALWHKKTKLNIFDTGFGHAGYAVRESDKKSIESIPTITIPEILEKYNIDKIDLLKIDIEGAEKELFEYDSDKWIGNVNAIFIEIHDRINPDCPAIIDKIIKEQKFFVYEYGDSVLLLRKER